MKDSKGVERKPAAAKRTKRPTGIADALRRAINELGLSNHRLAEISGIDVAGISRFRSGERSLSLESAEALADSLRLELKPMALPKK